MGALSDEQSSIRVLCVDDHRLMRDGLALIIGREPDMTVIGSAATGEEAVDLFCRNRPDITLMDLQLGRMSGVDAIRAIRKVDSDARIIVLTMFHGDEDVYRAMQAGAATYLVKNMLSDELIQIIRDVRNGQRPLAPGVRAQLERHALQPSLTSREVQVLELIGRGLRNKDIAKVLLISNETVRMHVKNLLAKLKVPDRMTAVNVAVQRGIIRLLSDD